MRHRRTFVHLGAVSEPRRRNTKRLTRSSQKSQIEKTEGSAPGFEAPTLLKPFVKQGSTRYMWWTSAEPKLAVSVTFVTNKVNLFFGGKPVARPALCRCENIRNSITCVDAVLYLAPLRMSCYLRANGWLHPTRNSRRDSPDRDTNSPHFAAICARSSEPRGTSISSHHGQCPNSLD
jgi:hypothetical protein